MKRQFFLFVLFTLATVSVLAQSKQANSNFVVTPKEYNGWKDALIATNGSVEVVIVPSIGRVMQFRFVGEEGVFWENPAVVGKPVNPVAKEWINFGGDKPWPAPQADWPKVTPRAWPPPVGFDASAWEAKIGTDSVELVSPVDPHYGIRAIRRIKLDAARPVMTITTVFEKLKGEPRNVAVWVITQLKDPDMILVPVPSDTRFTNGFNQQSKELPEYFKVNSGQITLKRDPKKSTKIGTDGTMLTWIGEKHALRIETSRTPNAVYPDNGSSAEVYTNLDPMKYVELEMLGPLKEMKIGDRLEHVNRYTLLPRSRITAGKNF